MPTPIEQALITLIPTITALPSELIDLSTSLLAQSRAKAATLKPEEEIARTFCVCNIAVERLKQALGIDKINARPPVPPRVYKKLYAYLDSALVKEVRGTPRTPRHRDAAGAGSQVNTPTSMRTRASVVGAAGGTPASVTRGTPGSARGGGASATAASGGRRSTRLPPKTVDAIQMPASASRLSIQEEHVRTSTNTFAGIGGPEKSMEVPKQAKEMITAICKAFDMPEAEQYVLAGCSTVLAARGFNETPVTVTESPTLSRKRTRESTAPAKHDEDEESGRGRKRRRTGIFTQAAPDPTPDMSPEKGEITTTTLPALLVALALYTIFTLKGEAVSGDEYNTARDTAISATYISPSSNPDPASEKEEEQEEVTKRNVATFLKAAHTEGWLEKKWALDVQAEAKKRQRGPDAEDVEMEDEGIPQAHTAAEQDEDEAVEEVGELQQTPRKPTRPAKTPLRRREKHAPRPSSGADGDDSDFDGLGRAGLRSGLGTMFQDAVDWLSEERSRDYRDWETWVRSEIERIEGQGLAVVEAV